MVESGGIEPHPSRDALCTSYVITLRFTSAATLMPRSLPRLVDCFSWLTASTLPSELIAIVCSNFLLTIAYTDKSAGYVVRAARFELARC